MRIILQKWTILRVNRALVMAILWVCLGPGMLPGEPESPREDEVMLRVHAIAWSEVPGRRVAVVGDQVLREGMTAGGIELLEIKPDRVELRVNGQRFTRKLEPPAEGLPAENPPVASAATPGAPDHGKQAARRAEPYQCAVELANIRRGPRVDSPVVARIKRGTPLKVIGQKGEWLRLRLRDNTEGWIHRSLAAFRQP